MASEGSAATFQMSLAVPHLQSKLDMINTKMERSLEIQEQNLSVQNEMLQCLKQLSSQVIPATSTNAVDSIAMDLVPKRFYEGDTFGSSAESSWFKWYLSAIFATRPASFDTDVRKRVFAVFNLSPKMYREYVDSLVRTNQPDSWDTLKAFLKW